MKIESTDYFYASNPLSPQLPQRVLPRTRPRRRAQPRVPDQRTKLMEPLITTAFLGPAARRHPRHPARLRRPLRADRQPQRLPGTATPLLPLGGQAENQLSLDGTSDDRLVHVPGGAGDTLDVVVQPSGDVLSRGQRPGRRTSAPARLDRRFWTRAIVHDLSFEIRDARWRAHDRRRQGRRRRRERSSTFELPDHGTYFIRVPGYRHQTTPSSMTCSSAGTVAAAARTTTTSPARGPSTDHPTPDRQQHVSSPPRTGEPDQTCASASSVPSARRGGPGPHRGTDQVTIDTIGSNFDTVLAVYTGTAVDNAGAGGVQLPRRRVRGSSTRSVSFDATSGTTYMIQVDGFGSKTGEIVTEHVGVGPLCNGTTTTPSAVRCTTRRATRHQDGETTSATPSKPGEPEPEHRLRHAGQRATAWWNWTAPSSGPVTIDTAGSELRHASSRSTPATASTR